MMEWNSNFEEKIIPNDAVAYPNMSDRVIWFESEPVVFSKMQVFRISAHEHLIDVLCNSLSLAATRMLCVADAEVVEAANNLGE